LLSHGFRPYKNPEDGDAIDIPFFGEGYFHFREIELNRQLFVVVFSENCSSGEYHPNVYVQEDIGCGFVEIPFPWWNLPIEYFEAVYYGIRGNKPISTPQTFTDAEYEIIEPKGLMP
jgi:hypothetical protein